MPSPRRSSRIAAAHQSDILAALTIYKICDVDPDDEPITTVHRVNWLPTGKWTWSVDLEHPGDWKILTTPSIYRIYNELCDYIDGCYGDMKTFMTRRNITMDQLHKYIQDDNLDKYIKDA